MTNFCSVCGQERHAGHPPWGCSVALGQQIEAALNKRIDGLRARIDALEGLETAKNCDGFLYCKNYNELVRNLGGAHQACAASRHVVLVEVTP